MITWVLAVNKVVDNFVKKKVRIILEKWDCERKELQKTGKKGIMKKKYNMNKKEWGSRKQMIAKQWRADCQIRQQGHLC